MHRSSEHNTGVVQLQGVTHRGQPRNQGRDQQTAGQVGCHQRVAPERYWLLRITGELHA